MLHISNRRDILRRRKGLGAPVGLVFIVLVLLLGMNSFMWQMSRINEYQGALVEVNAFDQERLTEDLDFQYPGITELSGTGPYLFKIIVNNNGPLDIEIVRIYIYHKDHLPLNSALTLLDPKTPSSPYGFEDGYISAAKFDHKIQVYSLIELDGDDQYEFRLVTKRGRLFTTIYPIPLTNVFVEVQQSQVVYSHDSMKVKRDGVYDWRPPYVSSQDVESNNLYVRAVFGNSGASSIELDTNSTLLLQVSNSAADEKAYFIGGHLIDPPPGWPGSLAIQPGTTEYLYFHIDSYNIPADEVKVFTGSAGLVGIKDGDFWSGAMLMDALKIS